MSGCFCYLVNHTEQGITDFIKSLTLLRSNYLNAFPAPVFAFHEVELTVDMRQRITEATGVDIQFEQLRFLLPTHILPSQLSGYRLGYMHMCQFFANDIFNQPVLQAYDYHCRLDTDSFILSPVRKDIFASACAAGYHYGFIDDSLTDQPAFVEGLWEVGEHFVATHPQHPTYARLYRDIPRGRVYYTNFELCYRPWFRQAPWVDYFAEIDQAGGVYYRRWGDHAIRYMGVRLYMPPGRIHRVKDIHYRHTYEWNHP